MVDGGHRFNVFRSENARWSLTRAMWRLNMLLLKRPLHNAIQAPFHLGRVATSSMEETSGFFRVAVHGFAAGAVLLLPVHQVALLLLIVFVTLSVLAVVGLLLGVLI